MEADMRTMVPTVAGLLTLAAVSAQAAPLPQPRRARPNSAPLRRSNWCAKAAAGVGTAPTGGTVGGIGIGVTAFRTGDFGCASALGMPGSG